MDEKMTCFLIINISSVYMNITKNFLGVNSILLNRKLSLGPNES